jgi:hypothetical protein
VAPAAAAAAGLKSGVEVHGHIRQEEPQPVSMLHTAAAAAPEEQGKHQTYWQTHRKTDLNTSTFSRYNYA